MPYGDISVLTFGHTQRIALVHNPAPTPVHRSLLHSEVCTRDGSPRTTRSGFAWSSAANTDETRVLLESLRPVEIATLLESTPPKLRRVIWDLLDDNVSGQVLQFLHDEVSAELLETMDTAELVAVADELEIDDFADLLQQLPQAIIRQVLDSLDQADRQ